MSVLCLSLSDLEGVRGSSCRVLPVLFVCPFRASKDSGVPAVGYHLYFLSVLFRPQGNVEFQLSGIVCYFCLSFLSGGRGDLRRTQTEKDGFKIEI